uniref:Uncharacterized protein n=1 Tax=Anopheles albimanus TaxID=7167 RepID=A0A182FUF9_ANOAL
MPYAVRNAARLGDGLGLWEGGAMAIEEGDDLGGRMERCVHYYTSTPLELLDSILTIPTQCIQVTEV